MKRKVVYIISDIDKSLAFEWIADDLKEFNLSFILIGKKSTQLKQFLDLKQIQVWEVADEHYPSFAKKWFRLFAILKKVRPDVVHAHLWRATILGMSVSWFLRTKKRIFTRHHATIHYDKYPSGLKWDKLCNWLATDIIAVSKNVENILVKKDGADLKKVHVVHHGFDLEYFKHVSNDSVQKLRQKYGIIKTEKWPVIGVISRYVDWKGIQYIIPAFAMLRESYPNAHLVLANATGDYAPMLETLLSELPAGSFTEIKFEPELAVLYRLFDVYIHVPVNEEVEAFGQTYIEALAAGIPSVFTLSGVASEFVIHQHNALVSPFRDPKSVFSNLHLILADPSLCSKLVDNAVLSVERFSLSSMIASLKQIYYS